MTKNRKFYTFLMLIIISSAYVFLKVMNAEQWSNFIILLFSIYGGANLGEHAIYKYGGGKIPKIKESDKKN